MAGLVPAIHAFHPCANVTAWMPATSGHNGGDGCADGTGRALHNLSARHGRACPGHPPLFTPARASRRGCPRQARAWRL